VGLGCFDFGDGFSGLAFGGFDFGGGRRGSGGRAEGQRGAGAQGCHFAPFVLFTALQRLDLHHNQLAALPESIGQLTALQQLNLR